MSIDADDTPLRLEEGGAIRVGKSRISLELVVEQYENGMTPEDKVRAYDTLVLADVYSTIAYYLRHRDEVRAYLKQGAEDIEALRAKIEAEHPRITREDLLKRSGARERSMLRLASDADVHGDIIRGLRRRLPSIDLLRAQDVLPESGRR